MSLLKEEREPSFRFPSLDSLPSSCLWSEPGKLGVFLLKILLVFLLPSNSLLRHLF